MLTVVLVFSILTASGDISGSQPAKGLPTLFPPSLPQTNDAGLAEVKAQADAGNSAAQLKLAQAYESGTGVPQDNTLAASWYKRAAEQGNPDAQDALGRFYLIGEGLEQNKKLAVQWFRRSARLGNANAMYHLGAAYYNGDGVVTDDSLSYAWFKIAKEAGNRNADEPVARAESELRPQQITVALNRIAEMYEAGGDLPENPAEAARWRSLAAARGDQDAQVALAMQMIKGQGVAQDFARGRHVCAEAAKQENHRAEYCLGLIYQEGLGVSRAPKKARSWYRLASRKGERDAMRALALMEASGEGGQVDRVGAFLLYARLAETGDEDTLHTLAELKKKITPKEWDQLQKPLLQLHIDPAKLERVLQRIDAH